MNEKNNPWKVLSEKEVYDNPWIHVSEYDVINPSGGKGIYGKVHFKNIAIGIVPLDDELNTWVVGQYRFAINQYSWEIPEGGGAIMVAPVESAKRELKEETGLMADKWTEILKLHLSNSVTDEFCYIFLAGNLTMGEATPEEMESLLVKKLPFNEVYEMVCRGEITDVISVAAIQKVKLMIMDNAL